MSVGQTMVLSLVMFSGASQFAFVGVAAAGGQSRSPRCRPPCCSGSATRSTACRCRRSCIRAACARLAPRTSSSTRPQRWPSARTQRPAKRYAFWATGLILCALWQLGTLAGALVGRVDRPGRFGLDAAAPAVYLALLWPRLRAGSRPAGSRSAGPPSPWLLVPFVPPGVPVIAAAAVVGRCAGARTRPRRRGRDRPVDRAGGRRRSAAICSSWPASRCRSRC